MTSDLISQLSGSVICWIILTVALVCYQRLAALWFAPSEERDCDNCISPTLISILPLLGLLGTIIGLLESFTAMQYGFTGTELFSAGIGDALLTTRLGLLCAVPAWLIHSALLSKQRKEG